MYVTLMQEAYLTGGRSPALAGHALRHLQAVRGVAADAPDVLAEAKSLVKQHLLAQGDIAAGEAPLWEGV